MEKTTKRQIVAFGGGGFSTEPHGSPLDLYVLAQSSKCTPNVCFIATASGDDRQYIASFYHAFARYECKASHLSIFDPPTRDLESFLLTKDVIYVGAGNTRNLLTLWREWDVDRILRKAWDAGIVLAGISAGAVCWFEQCLSDYIPGELNPLNCLSFLPGSLCPHYDVQPARRPAYRRLIGEGSLRDGVAVDDGVALHYEGLDLTTAVTASSFARAFHVRKVGNGVSENALEVGYLDCDRQRA